MLWGCFSVNGPGNLVKVEGLMRKEQCIKILEKNLLMELKKRVTAQKPSNLKDLVTFAKERWSRVPSDTCKKLVSFVFRDVCCTSVKDISIYTHL